MFTLVGIILSFFLAILLISKKDKTRSDLILCIWLFYIGIHLFFFYLIEKDFIYSYPKLLGLHVPLPLIHGPILFLYCKNMTSNKAFKFFDLIHFLPFFLSFFLFYDFLVLPDKEKIEVFRKEGAGFEIPLIINQIAFYISGILYEILSLIVLYKHKKRIQNEYSNLEKIQLDWLRNIILGLGIIWLAVIFGNDSIIYGLVVIFVILIGYFGIKQVGIFSENYYKQENPESTKLVEPIETDTTEKYANSRLSDVQGKLIHAKLMQIMDKEKPFKNPELTINKLAQMVEIHPNHLSQIINSLENRTFFDFINHYRVKEFIQKIKEDEHKKFTLLSIALDCGFNSKASFNRNFKKEIGETPSIFLKNLQTTDFQKV